VLAVPGQRQVQGQVTASVPGQAGGDIDEVGADGGAAGPGVPRGGQGAGRAEQVVGDGCEGEPGGVGGELARWQVCQRAADLVGEDLLDLGVVAVLFLGLDQGER